MSRLVRRCFSTLPPRLLAQPTNFPSSSSGSSSSSNPSIASASRTLPIDVRKRRTNPKQPLHPLASPSPLTDEDFHSPETAAETPKRLPLKLQLEFDQQRSQGRFPGPEHQARAEYLRAVGLWRGRVRGVAQRRWEFLRDVSKEYEARYQAEGGAAVASPKKDRARNRPLEEVEEVVEEKEGAEQEGGEESLTAVEDTQDRDLPLASIEPQPEQETDSPPSEKRLVAQRIYLPNIVVRLVRNFTPPGEAYDPNVATFRIPPEMTKLDLRSYLKAVYDLDVTFIRTTLYYGAVKRNPQSGRAARLGGWKHHYKKAVVGLYDPFHYPDDAEELRAQGAKMGLGETLWQQRQEFLEKNFQLERMLRIQQWRATQVYRKASRWRAKAIGSNRRRTVQEIAKRRREREALVVVEAKRKRGELSGVSAPRGESAQTQPTA